MLFRTSDIPAALGTAIAAGTRDYTIEQIAIDSRSANLCEHSAFICLVTPSGNGHHHIAEAYSKGVRCFVISEESEAYAQQYPQACFISTANTLTALQDYALARRQQSHARIVAITGSNGKTIVKEMLYSLLYREVRNIYRSPGSYNSQIGVALSLIGLKPDTELAFIEAGISRPGEMDILERMIAPDEVILTHLGSAHQENFTDLDELKQEKLKLAKSGCPLYTLRPSDKRFDDLMLLAPFNDNINRENLLLALEYIAEAFPDVLQRIHQYIPELRPVEMRLEIQENAYGLPLINDSYSNDLESLSSALESMVRLGGSALVLSPIEQSSLTRDELGQEVIRLLTQYHVRHVYLIDWADIPTEGTSFDVTHAISVGELLEKHRETLLSEYALLVKGARRYHLEELVQRLVLREHVTSLTVNLSSLRQNLNFYRSRLPHEAALICMIKADAYGLGAVEVARALESAHVNSLAVAVADEGKLLRQKGIMTPIIVMNPALDTLDTLSNYQLDAEVYSLELLELLGKRYKHKERPMIHLKVDTGMHRLGFRLEDISQIVYLIDKHQIRLSSIFSHLAGADEEILDSFTHEQAEYLLRFYNSLMASLEQISNYQKPYPYLHLLNTAGLERFSKAYALGGARLGVGLYGYSPTGRREVQPVAQLKTRILQVKHIAKGEHVGYNCRSTLERDSDIAIIPIGYADGLHRRYGNGKWQVNVGGVLCPILGNICMDACMIDVTEAHAQAGDEVIVFGDSLTPITRMAEAGETIPYEILTSISPRVVRIYLRD